MAWTDRESIGEKVTASLLQVFQKFGIRLPNAERNDGDDHYGITGGIMRRSLDVVVFNGREKNTSIAIQQRT